MNLNKHMYKHLTKNEMIEYHEILEFEHTEKVYTQEQLLDLYDEMNLLRMFEEMCFQEYEKHMRGFLHLIIGQESIYLAIKSIFLQNDQFIGSYRDHGLAYITGSSLQDITYELLGKKLGMCKGKGGSMHLYNTNFYGGHGIVGAQVPLGTGLAFAASYKNEEKVVFCFLGDGATNQGQVYESYNLALKFNLKIIYIIENNQFGMWTKWCDVTVTDNFYKKWNEMRSIRIKSNSFFVIKDAMEKIYKLVKQGPIVVQIDTYRYCGHSMKDKEKYRDEKEIYIAKEQDSILEIQKILFMNNCQENIKDINSKNELKIREYFKKAIDCDEPDISELFTDIIQ